jgi:predicted nucleotidyltransferase
LYENIIFHFVQTNTIASFHKFLHDKFATATIVVFVVGVEGGNRWTI